jgi:hypothetical protein
MSRPKQLYCGDGHSGLLTRDGNLYLWGWNQYGQCGNGIHHYHDTVNDSTIILTPLSSPLSIRVETAALGFSHTPIIEKDTRRLYAFLVMIHMVVTGRPHLHDHTAVEDTSKPTIPTMVCHYNQR